MWDPYAEFKTATLPNGLTVHAAHWPGRTGEAMGFVIHTGAEHDPFGLEGLSHFVEHVVSENLSIEKKEMKKAFDEWGAQYELGTTHYRSTYYSFFVPVEKENIQKALHMYGEMLLLARLEKLIERERDVILREFNRAFPVKFSTELRMRERKALYTGYWPQRFSSPLGNPESIQRITQADLQRHYDTHYTPANMSVVGVGSLTLEQLVDLLSASPFGGVHKPGARTPLPPRTSHTDPPFENRHVFKLSEYLKSEVGQYRSVARLPGTVHLRAPTLAGEMLNVRLTEEIRDRRAWTYSIGTTKIDYGRFWEFGITSNGLTAETLDEIEGAIEEVIASLFDAQDLFERTKHRRIAAVSMTDLNLRQVCKEALEDLGDDQVIKTLSEYISETQSLTMADIHEVLHWLRPSQRWTLIMRP